MPQFKDIADMNEDDRIDAIGQAAMRGATVAFVVDAEGVDGQEKADRYIGKLAKKFPGLRVLARGNGPVAGTVTVKIGPASE